jgi:excisionase family DNA binding protein
MWTPAEAADWHKVPVSTLYGWVRSGGMKCKRQGRLIWIATEEVLTYKPPAGERIRPAEEGESPRAGLVFGAAAISRYRSRARQAMLEREWALIQPVVEPSADRSEIDRNSVVEPAVEPAVERS